MHVSGVHPLFLVILLGAISLAVKSRSAFAEGKAPCFGVWAAVRDSLNASECVLNFRSESKRGPFVPEVLKAVQPMCWKRWYDCIFLRLSQLFRGRKRKQSAMGLSRDKITVRVYKGYIGKGRKEPDPLRAG